MGRMADARKRAQQKQKGGGGTEGSSVPPDPPADEPRDVREPAPAPDPPRVFDELSDDPPAETPASAVAPRWISREETLTFPAEVPRAEPEGMPHEPAPMVALTPPSSQGGRIALPSSGLASDILAREDALKLEIAAAQAQSADIVPVEPPTAVPFQNVSFFGPQSGRDDRKIAAEPMEHLVTFLLSDEEYGLDVRVVQEIIRLTEITHVPRSPSFIKGVINLRGRIIPVVDLKRKLELGEVTASRLSRIVVVKLRDRLIGLLVDGASQVLKIPVSSIDAAPEEILDVNVSFIRGVAKLQKRLIILLDLQKILAVEIEHAAAQ
jgi:purine-binding chemotaxis protein CheW